jgi:hypothetical protein
MLNPSGAPSSGNSWIIGGNLGLFTSPYDPQSIGLKTYQGLRFLTNNLPRLYLAKDGIAAQTGSTVGLGYDPSDSNRITLFSGGSVANEWHTTGNTLTGSEYLGSNNPFPLYFKTNSAKRLTINTNGALGLGTGEDYGTSGYLLESNGSSTAPTWIDPASLGVPISSLTAATSINSIDNSSYQQTWDWSSLVGSGLVLSTSSNAGVGVQLLDVRMTGTSSSAQDILGVSVIGTKDNANTQVGFYSAITGASTTNIAGEFSASGGTTNIAGLFSSGSVDLGQTSVQSGIMNFFGSSSGKVTIKPQAAAGTYNFNLPTTAGSAGQALISQGGGSNAMTWGSLSTGTVTSIATTSPITGGTITSTGTIACATCVVSAAGLTTNALVIGTAGTQATASTTTGTGVLTALGVNTGSAGAFVVNGGALGTPSSGTVTNLTGTASININGTVGATTRNTGAFTAVGIGQASTTFPLDVLGTETAVAKMAAKFVAGTSNAAGGLYIGAYNANYAGLWSTGSTPTQANYGLIITPNETVINSGTGRISFTINDAAAKMVVANTGFVGIATTSPNSTVHVNGSFATSYVAKTGTYTLTSSDYTVEATSGTFTATLPTAVGITGRIYVLTNSGSGILTVGTTSSQTFANVVATPTTLTLNQFATVTVQSNGSNWLRITSL